MRGKRRSGVDERERSCVLVCSVAGEDSRTGESSVTACGRTFVGCPAGAKGRRNEN